MVGGERDPMTGPPGTLGGVGGVRADTARPVSPM